MDGDTPFGAQGEDPTTEDLLYEQSERERAERERAEVTDIEDEEHAATRRADKAAYLRAKLEEQAEHPSLPDESA